MNIGYYDKLLTFLNHDVEKLNVDDILAKGEELEVTFPNSLVRFYYYFGNCNEVLNGYYKFFKLEDIKIWHECIVFGTKELSENNLNIYTCLICPVCRYNTLKYVSIPAVLCLTQNKLSCV